MKVILSPRIRIGASTCRIKNVPHLSNDDGLRGYHNRRNGEIGIESTLEGERRDRTLLHEIVHQIDDSYGVGLSDENVDRIGNGIYEFLENLHIELDWGKIK